MLPIEIDDVSTWPSEVKPLLEKNFDMLSLYAAEELIYPNLSVEKRSDFVNPYFNRRERVLNQINEEIKGHHWVGYHCTRILDDEMINIKNKGLIPSSPELLADRVKFAIDTKTISPELGDYVLSNNLCSEKSRQGRICFVCKASILKEERMVVKFFKSWGGEVVYKCHVNDELSWLTLQSIGKPCIIKAALIPNKTSFTNRRDYYTWNLGEMLETAFLQNKGVNTENDPKSEWHVMGALKAEQILKIIPIEDTEFFKLTNYESWSTKLTPSPIEKRVNYRC